jgi:uracil-DNA glycosylase family 4
VQCADACEHELNWTANIDNKDKLMAFTDDHFNPDPSLFDTNFVFPKGASKDVLLYIVGGAPGKDDVEGGLSFLGQAGKVLDRAISESNAASAKIRFFNAIPYRPVTGDMQTRAPGPDEIKKYSSFVMTDIEKVRPKVIILTGESAMAAFGIDMAVDEARVISFKHNGIPVLVTHHPSHVLQTVKLNSLSLNACELFNGLIGDLNKALSKTKDPIEWNYEQGSQVIDVLDWDKVEELLVGDAGVILDYEASGLKTYQEHYFVGGLALKGRTSKKCIYVRLYDFWRTPDEFAVSDKLKAKIGLWLLSKQLTVFNLQYEAGATLSYFNVYLRDVTDVMLWNRCLGYKGSLKDIAVQRLGVRAWNTDVDEWTKSFSDVTKKCFPTYKKNIREEIKFILNERPHTIDQVISWMVDSEKMNKRKKGIQLSLSKINNIGKKYYQGPRYEEFCQRYFKLLLLRSTGRDDAIHYTDIPLEIIAPYALEDVNNTDRIRDHMEKEIKEASLDRAAEIYNSLAKLGFEMESAGIAWNDALATSLSNVYLEKAVSSLRSLLMISSFQKILKSPNSNTGQTIADCPGDILTIQTTTDIKALSAYFNPMSNHDDTRAAFSALVTTERLKFIVLMHEVFKEYEVNKEECAASFPVLTPILEGILECYTTEEDNARSKITAEDVMLRLAIVDNQVNNSERLAKKIQSHQGNGRARTNRIELDMFIKYAKWRVTSIKSSIIEDLYSAVTNILGLNVDDSGTWCEEFKSIYWFRVYKKVMKSYSTYIWGKNGRNAVTRINRESVYELIHPRRPGWSKVIPNGQIWLKETKFGVCSAVTKRFQSGDHNVPGSELMDLRVSRFVDGIIVHYDYSQQEVRVLARIANENRLLEAFQNEIDIHSFIASQVWRKPEKEVSKTERRYTKAATFSIIYGDTPSHFAVRFVNGNVPLAKTIFDTFYGSFPGVRRYVDESHKFALEHGYVKTYLGDPIRNIEMPPEALALSDFEKEVIRQNVYSRKVRFGRISKEKDKLIRKMIAKSLRNSQNYPIQSTASVLAGLGADYINGYLRDRDMTSRICCFTHDSNDIDAQIADLPEILSVLPRFAVNELVKEFDIPIKTDFEIGVSGGKMIGLKRVEVDGKIITCEFHGSEKSALDDVYNLFTGWGVRMDIEVTGEEMVYRSMSELFLAKGAYALSMGNSQLVVTGKMRMDFSEVRRSNHQ